MEKATSNAINTGNVASNDALNLPENVTNINGDEEELLNMIFQQTTESTADQTPNEICDAVLGDWRYDLTEEKFINIKTGLRRAKPAFNDTFKDQLPIGTDDDGKVKFGVPSMAFLHGAFFDGGRGDYTEIDATRTAGEIVTRSGIQYINTYIDRGTSGVSGDYSMFTDLLSKLFVNADDTELLLKIMKWIIVNRGNPKKRLGFCPMIVGIEGNGKTTIVNILKRAIGRDYFIAPQASDLDGQFNGFLHNKLLCNFDELKVAQCNTIGERLKPWITGEDIAIRKMNTDTFNAVNVTSFVITTNNVNALMQNKGNTRFCNFMTQHQDGEMDEFNALFGGEEAKHDYYEKLYKWLDNGGYEICIDFILNSVDISDFNGSGRAPKTSVHATFMSSQKSNNEMKLDDIFAEYPVLSTKQFARVWVANGNGSTVPSNKVLETYLDNNKFKSDKNGKFKNVVKVDGGTVRLMHRSNMDTTSVKTNYVTTKRELGTP
jgi:hypothetical protein